MNNQKECTKCKEVKTLKWFNKNINNIDGLMYICKICCAVNQSNRRKTKQGKLKAIYDDQKKSSKRRRDENPKYTSQEFIERYINNEDYLLLYNDWVESNYDIWLSPSFDRKDDYKPYSFDNFNKWMTWQENKAKYHLDAKNGVNRKKSKAVIGTNIKTGETIVFYSGREAERKGFHNGHINSCCRGKGKTHKGYFWSYKDIYS